MTPTNYSFRFPHSLSVITTTALLVHLNNSLSYFLVYWCNFLSNGEESLNNHRVKLLVRLIKNF